MEATRFHRFMRIPTRRDVSQQLGDMASFTGSCGFRPGRSFENHARFIKVLPGETGEAVGDTCGVLIRFAEEGAQEEYVAFVKQVTTKPGV